jgi:adenine-specific DNA-methyltransferase
MASPSNRYGPENPHPLSQLKTELVWEGKYDEYGRRREVDIAGAVLPLQKIETIDEPRSRAEAIGDQRMLFALNEQVQKLGDFRNQLIWGDNKLVMASLLKEFQGKIDLIYIDPPFDVGADFTMQVPLGDGDDTIEKDQSALEFVAYRDMWGNLTDSYLYMMYERLTLMKALLSDTGSIFVHCDWHVVHLLRSVLAEIFGTGTFRNEIIWYYYNKMQGNVNRFAANHDVILWHTKTDKFQFRPIREKRDQTVRQIKRVWDKENAKLVNAKDEDGHVIYIETDERTVDDVWRISMLQPADKTQNLGFATQKPEALLERIIEAASLEGGLVADFFCGSGTTGAVAERLGRRWIMSDLGRFAIHTSRKRLIELQRTLHSKAEPYRAFDVYNLGRYERQWWQKEYLKGADQDHRRVVLEFYKAEAIQNSTSSLLHGRKGRALVHVDSIDSIFSRRELRLVAEAAKAAGAEQLNCLAWEFEMDLRLQASALQAELGIEIRLVRIPREIMEKNRTQVAFFEIATLHAEPVITKAEKRRVVNIKLKTFLPSLAEIPERELEALEQRAIKHGFDFIDFWAVDFDYRNGQPFKHHWQAYRTRRDRSLPTVSDQNFAYPSPGKYTVCVKVVDTFGCDTSITVPVEM